MRPPNLDSRGVEIEVAQLVEHSYVKRETRGSTPGLDQHFLLHDSPIVWCAPCERLRNRLCDRGHQCSRLSGSVIRLLISCHTCDGVTFCCCSSWAGREISLSTLCCAVKENTFRIRSFSLEYSRTSCCMSSHGAIVSSTVSGMFSSTQLALVSSDVILAFLKAASALRNQMEVCLLENVGSLSLARLTSVMLSQNIYKKGSNRWRVVNF